MFKFEGKKQIELSSTRGLPSVVEIEGSHPSCLECFMPIREISTKQIVIVRVFEMFFVLQIILDWIAHGV